MIRLGSIAVSIVCESLRYFEQIRVGVRDKGIAIAFVGCNFVGIQDRRLCSI